MNTTKFGAYIRLLRPHNWIKNLLVFAAILFSGKITHPSKLLSVTLVFVLFCLLSSLFYVLNDWMDRKQDRMHPEKSSRPIASGTVGGLEVIGISSVLVILFSLLLLNFPLNTRLTVFSVLMGYAFIQVIYNLFGKHTFGIDILLVASGYVIRAIAGGVSIDVPVTHWFLLTIFLLCFLLVTGKRRSDLVRFDSEAASNHRQVLEFYSIPLLDRFITLSASASFVTYCLYTVSENGGQDISEFGMPLSIVFVLFGLMRYLYLIYEQEKGEAPTWLFLNDLPLVLSVVSWSGFIFALIVL